MGSYSIVVDASAEFAGADWPFFTLYADGQAVSGAVPVNTSSTQQIAFAVNLADGVAHSIQIATHAPASATRVLTIQDIRLQGQTIASQSSLESYVSTNGTVSGTGRMTNGGQINFDLPASYFGGPQSAAPAPPPGPPPAPPVSAPTPPPATPRAPTPAPTPSTGTDVIVVNATATLAGGIGAHFNLLADGVKIGEATVGATAGSYSFNTTLAATQPHDIQVVYDNDAVINGVDRNLLLRSLVIDGQTVNATDSQQVYHAPLNPGPGDIASNGNMYWNGVAEFRLPAGFFAAVPVPIPTPVPEPTPVLTPAPAPTPSKGTSIIVVNATATVAGGIGAHFNLLVDGVRIGEATVGAVSGPFSFNTTLAVNQAHDIQIAYDNDAVINGVDRNLLLQSLVIDGQTVNATDSREVYHAPFNPGPGDVASSGNMYWNGTAEFRLPAAFFPAAPIPQPAPTPTPASSAIVVGGGSQYSTIQQGIAAAEKAGIHTVLLSPGAYQENVSLTNADNGVTLSAVSGNVTLTGSLTIVSASSVTISGLAFRGNGSNTGISTRDSRYLTITDNAFNQMGQAVVLDGTVNSSISNNLITNTTNTAIEAMNGADSNTIDSNVITGDGNQGTVGAIWLHGSNNSTITHNQLSNVAGAGISLGDFYGPGTTATENNNVTIAYNTLNSVETLSQDSGAIYILGRSQNPMSNDVIKMNFIGGTGSSGAHAVGIYLDDNASGVSVTGNIIQATAAMSDAFQIHGGSNNSISGNIFDLGAGNTSFGLFQQDEANEGPQGSFAQLTKDVVTGNIFVTGSTAPRNPAFSDLTGGIGNISISANDFWAYSGVTLNVGGTGSHGDSAAKFVAPAAKAAQVISDYATWSNAGVGFKAVDTTLIGLAPIGAHAY